MTGGVARRSCRCRVCVWPFTCARGLSSVWALGDGNKEEESISHFLYRTSLAEVEHLIELLFDYELKH